MLAGPARATLEGDPVLWLDYRVDARPGDGEGFPMLWVDRVDPNLTLQTPDGSGHRAPIAIGGRAADGRGFLQAAVTSPLVAEAESGRQPPPPGAEATLGVSALWRGEVSRLETAVSIDPVPDSTVGLPGRVGPARLSVRADADRPGLVGNGRAAVSFLLDCSGSMAGPVGPTTKYQAVVDMILRLLAEVPRGTLVEVWTFGQRVGPSDSLDDAERTIRPAFPLAPWDPTDRDRLQQLAGTLRGLSPTNGSPIVRALVRAKDSLLGVDGPRLIVAMTDGADNRFDQEVSGQVPRPTIAGYLLDQFRNAGVQVLVAGFRVDPRERPATLDQFRVFEVPPLRGRLLLVDDLPALEATVRSSIRPEVRYQLEDPQGALAPGVPADGQGVGFPGGGDRFLPSGLEPGPYRLRFLGQPGPGQPVELGLGDTLILRLEGGPGRLSARRDSPSFATDLGLPTARAGGWTSGVVASRWSPAGTLELDIAMSKVPVAGESPLRVIRPARISVDASPRDPAARPPSLRLVELAGRTTPTYRVFASGWPEEPGADRPSRPVVRIWWTERPPAAGLTLRRGFEFEDPAGLRGRSFPADGGRLEVRSIGVERRVVEVAPGRSEPRSCLVLRLVDDAGRAVRVGLDRISLEGAEYRHYAGEGTTTALFWPVEPRGWEQAPLTFRFEFEARLRADAEAAGLAVRFDALPTPEASAVPSPPAPRFDPSSLPPALPGRD
jgi:hypothetical protein